MGKCFLITLLTTFSVIQGNAQQAVVVAGNSATGTGGSISYSIGQIDYTAFNGNTNGGVQQAYIVLALPVTWLNFSAVKDGANVLLKWETANEINSDHFVVQRSINSNDFTAIGTVAATGTGTTGSKYSLIDKSPNKGYNYYRVKQVDKDGKFIYSAIAAINFGENVSITCYPNPTTSSLNIHIGSTDVRGYTYQLTDMNGRLRRSSKINTQLTTISMNSFNPGSYVLKVLDSKGAAISFVIVKN